MPALQAVRPPPRGSAVALAAALPLACAAAQAAGDAPALELAVRAHAEVVADRVTLRDLVSLQRDDAGVAGRLMSIDIGPAPRIGQPAHVDRAQLQAWIRSRDPSVATFIEWRGAESVEIERASRTLPAAELDAMARRALDDWLASRSDRHEIAPQGEFESVQTLVGRVSTAVRPLADIAVPSSHMAVWVDVSVDGHFQRSVVLDYRVRAYRQAWVAAEDLPRGLDLDGAHAVAGEVDIATSTQPLWTQPVDHARLRRAVRKGQALTTLDVEDRPPVVRGERVVVASHAGDLSIEANAEALQDGRIGQDVMVRIATSSAPLMARVIQPGLVEIRQ